MHSLLTCDPEAAMVLREALSVPLGFYKFWTSCQCLKVGRIHKIQISSFSWKTRRSGNGVLTDLYKWQACQRKVAIVPWDGIEHPVCHRSTQVTSHHLITSLLHVSIGVFTWLVCFPILRFSPPNLWKFQHYLFHFR